MRRNRRAPAQPDVEESVRARLYGGPPLLTVAPAPVAGRPAVRLGGGRYQLLERLGAGGTAVVHRARDERLERDVAVKVLADGLARVPPVVRRFRREGRLCARLAHPNIVAVLDAGEDPQEFIVMELVRGLDAGSLMRSAGPLPPVQVVRVISQVCEALEYAHGEGVVHRDLSPRNILLGLPDGAAKLADFAVPPDAPTPEAGAVTATPGYIAPEVLRGAAPSPRSDLYALGVVAYRLLGGPPARAGDPEATVPTTTAASVMPRLETLRGDLPRGLCEAVQQAMAERPHERQRSVAEFRAQLAGERRGGIGGARDGTPFGHTVSDDLQRAA